MYAIVDIETTGSSANYGRITEVAILIHDGKRVIDEYQSLINPEVYIPNAITNLTGITNQMVAEAPTFAEIAEDILAILKNHIFVAHNVNFDYSFLKKEFQGLGHSFHYKKLCTVRLSRKIFPGLPSYSLGRLCNHFGIPNHARHRAMGDARATTHLLDKLLSKDNGQIADFLKRNSKEADLPPNLPKHIFEDLPSTTGVYYFHDHKGKVLYVGKANDIKKRIRGHFSSTDVIYKQGLKDQIHDISFELCGDEMIALLFEAYEIRRLFPPFNKAQKYPIRKYGLFHYLDGSGQPHLSIAKIQKGLLPLKSYNSFDRARNALIELVKAHGLDPELCGLPQEALRYFGYSFKPVATKELIKRFEGAISNLSMKTDTFVLIGKGKTSDECSMVLVEEGIYQGFCFVNRSEQIAELSELKDRIRPFPDHPDARRIIDQFKEKREILSFQ